MREFAQLHEILIAVRHRLIDQIEPLHEGNCIVSDLPLPHNLPVGDLFCTIAAGNGKFSELFAGGGEESVHELATILITLASRTMLDSAGRSDIRLLHQERGILTRFKPQLLAALLKNWEPTTDGVPLLRDRLVPLSSEAPRRTENGQTSLTCCGITFEASFDWRL